LEFILVGQPNGGKSTIFNEVVGYKSMTANFPGATVEYMRGEIVLNGQKISVVDLPGNYSLHTSDDAEMSAIQYLMNKSQNAVLINVIDASVLSRSLELTLQLMEMKRPMVVALNMMDEAERKGIRIDGKQLSNILGIPVIETIGRKGEGIFALFNTAFDVGKKKVLPNKIQGPKEIERVSNELMRLLKDKPIPKLWDIEFISWKLIEGDDIIRDSLKTVLSDSEWRIIGKKMRPQTTNSNLTLAYTISSFRHNMAFQIFEKVARVGKPSRKDIRETIDDLLMHPLWGYIFLVLIFYLTFFFIFTIGGAIEPQFIENFEKLRNLVSSGLKDSPILLSIVNGFIQGFGGGIGIVIPFLLPFFIVLSLFEDTGYLARVAYLIDNIMHRIGLHGMSAVPMILGYGCTVPGIMATRILKSPRDKFITATLTTLIPCSARMTIIFGLVGFFISIKAAIIIYLLNLIIIGLTGKVMSKLMPEVSPGLVLEIPKYHIPRMRTIIYKTWFRLKELAPFTSGVLGLPVVLGITLVFGIMRKELALVLLFSALGTKDILSVMTQTQIFSFTIFITFYIPCLATFAVLAKELTVKRALLISGLTVLIAIALSLLVRAFSFLF